LTFSPSKNFLPLAGVVVEVHRDEHHLVLPLGRQLVPRRQLLLARLAPRAAEGHHDPLAPLGLEPPGLAAAVLGAVELGRAVALLDLGDGGSRGGQGRRDDGDHSATHGYSWDETLAAGIQRESPA
jgi:hypothetical protein